MLKPRDKWTNNIALRFSVRLWTDWTVVSHWRCTVDWLDCSQSVEITMDTTELQYRQSRCTVDKLNYGRVSGDAQWTDRTIVQSVEMHSAQTELKYSQWRCTVDKLNCGTVSGDVQGHTELWYSQWRFAVEKLDYITVSGDVQWTNWTVVQSVEVCRVTLNCSSLAGIRLDVIHSVFRSLFQSDYILYRIRSRASPFNFTYPFVSLRSSSSFLRLFLRLPVISIPLPFPSIVCSRRHFLRKMWPIQ